MLNIWAFLTDKAFVPYIEMLSKWIYQGIVDDQFDEFLVLERKDVNRENISKEYNDNYWDLRF